MRALIILLVLATPALARMRPPDDSALSPSQVTRVMKSRQPAFKRCFATAVKQNPKLTGTFVYRFTIEATGRVSKAVAALATADSAPVDKCIVAAIKKIVFPKSTGPTTINYPFISTPVE
ncbi:MAG: AgmX/PglI C-terminal domain-containing protein [Polyangiales bacterium]